MAKIDPVLIERKAWQPFRGHFHMNPSRVQFRVRNSIGALHFRQSMELAMSRCLAHHSRHWRPPSGSTPSFIRDTVVATMLEMSRLAKVVSTMTVKSRSSRLTVEGESEKEKCSGPVSGELKGQTNSIYYQLISANTGNNK